MKQLIHILKKDVRYLWSELALYAVVLALYVWTELHPDTAFITLPYIAKASLPIFAAYMIARLVHAEPVPGSDQFWITRPYRYGSLLLAKLTFIVLCIGVPMFAARFVLMRLQGFPVLPGALDLAWSQMVMLLLVALPVFALASVTANLTQLFVAFVIGALVPATASFAINEILRRPYGTVPPFIFAWIFRTTGVTSLWVPDFLAVVVLVLFCALVLWAQYRGRTTAVSRAGIAAGFVLCIVANYATPFGVAAAVNRGFYHDLPAGSPLQVHMDMSSLRLKSIQEYFSSMVLIAPMTVTGIPNGYRVRVPALSLTFDDAGESKLPWFRPTTSEVFEGSGNFQSTAIIDRDIVRTYQGKLLHGHASIDLLLFPPPLQKTVRLSSTPTNLVDGVQCYLAPPSRAFLRNRCRVAVGWPGLRLLWMTKGGVQRVFTDIQPGPFDAPFSPLRPVGLDLNSVQEREAGWEGDDIQSEEVEILMDAVPQKLHVDLNFDSIHFPAPSPE